MSLSSGFPILTGPFEKLFPTIFGAAKVADTNNRFQSFRSKRTSFKSLFRGVYCVPKESVRAVIGREVPGVPKDIYPRSAGVLDAILVPRPLASDVA